MYWYKCCCCSRLKINNVSCFNFTKLCFQTKLQKHNTVRISPNLGYLKFLMLLFNKKLFLIRFYCLCGSFQFENENVSSEMKSSAECLLGRDFDRREITFQFGFLVKMFSNAKLRKQTTFLKFSLYLYFCFSICV